MSTGKEKTRAVNLDFSDRLPFAEVRIPSPTDGISGTDAEIRNEVELAIDQLTVVRDVYDRQQLRELARLLPYEVARDNKAILLERQNDGTFFVGMCNHTNFINTRNVARSLHVQTTALRPRVLSSNRFDVLLQETYDQAVLQLQDDSEDEGNETHGPQTVDWNNFEVNVENQPEQFAEPEIEIGAGTGLRAQAEKIILAAIAQRASDIHLCPGLKAGYIKFRTDGVCYPAVENIPAARMENLANAFCDMAGVNGYEVMQDEVAREININLRSRSGKIDRRTLRFQGTPGYYGRLIVIRIQSNDFHGFDMIGLEPDQISQIQNSLFYRSGLCLVTGPTGSGKSNTLEAMLRQVEQIHDGRVNVIQIGNPIEFPNEKRLQIPLKTDSDWDRAFNATLRMDPDILSPGEFRNAAEAAVVFQAAATGHLTLTTLHTNNVAQTFSRLDFLGIERDKQAALLKLIASQELAPLLCPHCKAPDPRAREIADRLCELVFPNRKDLRDAIANARTLPFFHRVGCGRCNNHGIKLRTCIAEVLTVTPDISLMLRNNVDGDDIVKHAITRHGMITLAEAAARKLCRGLIGYDDVFHLLISTNVATPETQNYPWQTQATDVPYVDAEVVTDEYIDADIEYTEDQKRAAA